ncbi:MAG: TetR/AcrR family transcriptional regulator [Lachnospiraceae bacterium]
MSNDQIVQPRQKRSIEKKQKLIEAGIKLFSENSYTTTTIAELAKEAGVSVGIVYRYFSDKKDILLDGMDVVMVGFKELFRQQMVITPDTTIKDFLNQYLAVSYQTQGITSPVFFNELIAMAYTDSDIAEKFTQLRMVLKDLFSSTIFQLVDIPEYPDDKIDMVLNLLTNYNHKVVYGKSNLEKKEYMQSLTIDTAISILEY